jgi:hypothetical protein
VRGIGAEAKIIPKPKTFIVQNVKKIAKQTSTFTLGYTKTIEIVYDVFDFILNLKNLIFVNHLFKT